MKAGWEMQPLGSICENLDSKRVPITKNKRVAGDIPYYGASGIVDWVQDYLFDEDLLLVSEDGANLLARTYPIAFSVSGRVWVNNHAHVLRFTESVTQKYVELYLNSISIEDHVSGMAQPKLNQGKLSVIPIPLPPLEEQNRIVAVLDEAFAALDRARAHAETNLKNARELFESKLATVFEAANSDWHPTTLDQVCDVRDGTHDSPKYVENGVPFVTQKNVRKGGLTLDNTKRISEEDHNLIHRRSNVAEGDILISMIGVNRGMACLVDTDEVFSIKNVGLIKATQELSMDFLLYFLKSRTAEAYVSEATNGGAQPFIGLKKLRAFPISLPTRSRQFELVAQLASIETEVAALEESYLRKTNDLENLRQSLLQRAFAGELT